MRVSLHTHSSVGAAQPTLDASSFRLMWGVPEGCHSLAFLRGIKIKPKSVKTIGVSISQNTCFDKAIILRKRMQSLDSCLDMAPSHGPVPRPRPGHGCSEGTALPVWPLGRSPVSHCSTVGGAANGSKHSRETGRNCLKGGVIQKSYRSSGNPAWSWDKAMGC